MSSDFSATKPLLANRLVLLFPCFMLFLDITLEEILEMSLAINQIHLGDARELLHQVEPNSITCSVWSPPYHVGKAYEKDMSYEDWVDLLKEVIRLHYPILKPGGFLVINIADIL